MSSLRILDGEELSREEWGWEWKDVVEWWGIGWCLWGWRGRSGLWILRLRRMEGRRVGRICRHPKTFGER